MADSDTGDSGQDVIEVNVGFDGEDGRKTAIDASVDVVRELESIDVLTVRIPREKWSELDDHPQIRYVEENGQAGTLGG